MPEIDGGSVAGLGRVRWIGGAPDGGKTTVADLIGERVGVTVYHFDRYEMDHVGRADPGRHPELVGLGRRIAELGEHGFLEDNWVRHPVEEMARRAIASWSERMELVLEDLEALPGERPIVAEGPGFFPEVIAPVLADPHGAVWLVPTPEFKRAAHARRGKTGFAVETSDPERAYRNHVERDLLLAEHVRRGVRELGLRMIEVDGSRSVEEIAGEVAGWFGLAGV